MYWWILLAVLGGGGNNNNILESSSILLTKNQDTIAYQNFINAIKSSETKQKYYLLEIINLKMEIIIPGLST